MARRMLKRKPRTQPKWEQVHRWLREAASEDDIGAIGAALASAQAAAKKWPNPRSREQTALGPNIVRAIDDIAKLNDPGDMANGARVLAAWVARESRVRVVARAQALARGRLPGTSAARRRSTLAERLIQTALAAVAGRLRHA